MAKNTAAVFRLSALALLLAAFSSAARAQAPAGYTKIATVTSALTYTDTAVVPGNAFEYVVTAVSAAGQETGPSNSIFAVTPSAVDPTAATDCGTGNAHCTILTWMGTTPPAPQFNVYRQAVPLPSTPTGLGAVEH